MDLGREWAKKLGILPDIKYIPEGIKDVLKPAFDRLKMPYSTRCEEVDSTYDVLARIREASHYRFDAKDLWDLLGLDCVFIATSDTWLESMTETITKLYRVGTNQSGAPILDIFIDDNDEFSVRVISPKGGK